MPYAFTQEGIAMLSGIIKTKEVGRVNVEIMRQFVKLRKFVSDSNLLQKDVYEIKNKLIQHDDKINELFDKFDKKEEFKNKIFFDGQIYDAYSLLIDVIRKANDDIIIIDNYVDKITLDILSKKNINVTVYLITDENKSKLTQTDILKFNKEYPKLEIKYTNKFHDRFIIIDKTKLYHLGTSLKDLGNKVFAVNKIEDKEILKRLIFKINM